MRWPLMTKARHQSEMAVLSEAAANAVDREYARAMKDGKALVHAWAREACFGVYTAANPASAAQAAFQQAEHLFRPEPLTLSEVLYAPAVTPA